MVTYCGAEAPDPAVEPELHSFTRSLEKTPMSQFPPADDPFTQNARSGTYRNGSQSGTKIPRFAEVQVAEAGMSVPWSARKSHGAPNRL